MARSLSGRSVLHTHQDSRSAAPGKLRARPSGCAGQVRYNEREPDPPEGAMSATPTSVPDVSGRFGPYGGRYVPETLMHALHELTRHYEAAREDPEFQKQFDYY